jgi:hypothetical protein
MPARRPMSFYVRGPCILIPDLRVIVEINTNTTEVIIILLSSIIFLWISIYVALRPFEVLNLIANIDIFKYRLMGLRDDDIKYVENPLGKVSSQKLFRNLILDPDPNPDDYQRLITIFKIFGYTMSAIIGFPLVITIGIIIFTYL